ncbi:MAG TPA: ATP-dependent Clp protease adaptor ClpS [Phycisphaerae bacterium]|jgi:ATP-dependent Clp protease adapter protein ClpS
MSYSEVVIGRRTYLPGTSWDVSVPEPVERFDPCPEELPPYRVLLHNDDVNHVGEVIDSIMTITPLSRMDAVQKTLEAHRAGISLLLITHKERAELYVEQFASCKLTVTIDAIE